MTFSVYMQSFYLVVLIVLILRLFIRSSGDRSHFHRTVNSAPV
nr:MAG TPA: hypothetical protein [Caudoviricetes sp.]